MAHELTRREDGTVEMFSAGPTPVWHRLGQRTDEAVDSTEALRLGGLYWGVETRPVSVEHEGAHDHIPTHRAVVRTDTQRVLGVVSHRYTPIQNTEAFEWLDSVTGSGLAAYETAGSIRGGKVVWMMLRLPEELRVAGTDDVTRPYLLACNSHDGTRALRVLRTGVRVVCSNTLTWALGSGVGVSLRHTGRTTQRLEDARRVLGLASRGFRHMNEEMNAMARVQLGTRGLDEYLKRVWPDEPGEVPKEGAKKVRNRMTELFDDEPQRLKGVRGSVWAAWNAVSQYTDWERRHRGGSRERRDENRLRSIWFGDSAEVKRRAWNEALAVARSN